MYLSTLQKEEKESFLNLAYFLSNIDRDFHQEEKQMLDSYCVELGVSFDENIAKRDEKLSIAWIEEHGPRPTKKIMIFELVGLAMCDGKYDEHEKNFIAKLAQKWDVEPGYIAYCEAVVDEYVSLQQKINSLVLGQ